MKVSVILAHPNKKSFNHAIAHAVLEQLQGTGWAIYFHDLYEEKFDPLLPTEDFDLCGVRNFYRRMLNMVVVSTEVQRSGRLEEVKEIVQSSLIHG